MNPMNHSTLGLPVHNQLPEATQLMSIESVMPSNHLILCHPLHFLPSIFSSISSVQFSSVAHSCPTLYDPMNCSTPSLQARLQQCVNHELPDVQVGFRKGRGTEIKLPTSTGSSKKQESSRKTSISALLTMSKSLTLWITITCEKF